MNSKFLPDVMEKMHSSRNNDWEDNWDFRRFDSCAAEPLIARVKALIKGFLQLLGLRSNPVKAALMDHEAQLQWLYERLQDEESRGLLIDLMAYRALGHRRVKLPLNTTSYWQKLDALDRKAVNCDSIELDFRGWKLDRFDLSDQGYPIQLFARPSGVYTQLLLQQYRCVTNDHAIEVVAGETVIDAGGCYGDTALYFAHKVGTNGRVFSFEFMPNNISIFQKNLALNPELKSRVKIVPHPVWSTSALTLFVEGVGPASRITSTPKSTSSTQVETLSIDELANRECLERIDFIKMDIEGAELEALMGAETVIRRDRPKLAISVYHKLHDFWSIPQWIESLDLGYRFYLRHFTIHAEETVLFAEVAR